MTSAERLCVVAARSEALLADFVILFAIRWGLKYLGLEYYYCQPFLDQASPPFAVEDLRYWGSAVFWGVPYFVSGLPELWFAGLWFVYAVLGMSIFGRTLGMRQAGVVLVSREGRKPGILKVLIRQLLAPFCSIALIGYWPLTWTSDGTALHDSISGTRVVMAEKKQARVESRG